MIGGCGGNSTKIACGRAVVSNLWNMVIGTRGPSPTVTTSSGPSPTTSWSNNGILGHADPLVAAVLQEQQQQQPNRISAYNDRLPKGNFGSVPTQPINEIAQHRVVFLGEVHSVPIITSFQREVLRAMATASSTQQPTPETDRIPSQIRTKNMSLPSSSPMTTSLMESSSVVSPLSSVTHDDDHTTASANTTRLPSTTEGTLHLIMEHFSFEMQPLLDQYMSDQIDFDTLVKLYHEAGTENHDLEPYRDILLDAKAFSLSSSSFTKGSLAGSDKLGQDAHRPRQVKLHAGFLPRKYARMLLKEGKEAVMNDPVASKWLPTKLDLTGSPFHYNVFESLLSGRSLYPTDPDTNNANKNTNDANKNDGVINNTTYGRPSDQFRRIFQAQVLKDEAMAYRVSSLLDESDDRKDGTTADKYLIIAGNGHLLHYTGVPERVFRDHPEIALNSCLVISERTTPDLLAGDDDDEGDENDNNSTFIRIDNNKTMTTEENSLDMPKPKKVIASDTDTLRRPDPTLASPYASYLQRRFGKPGSNPADFVFLYEIPDEMDEIIVGDSETTPSSFSVKEETKNAYDKVGDTASFEGNTYKAAWIMYNLGYSEDQFKVAGPDAYNFQGVGNPHHHANIQENEIVLDVGSGLGIDSIIASHAVGPNGLVLGIDFSEKEVLHAKKRAKERGIENLKFHVGDMENMKRIPDNSIDVIISNGAFCLAPNKEIAFAELYRVLRPGGRISVCTTTVRDDNLEPGVSWPLCMQMFIPKDAILPMCERVGFENVVVDDSDSQMSMDIPEDALAYFNPSRNSVHVGGEEFKHLEGYDMDKICARVCVVAQKPNNVFESGTETLP